MASSNSNKESKQLSLDEARKAYESHPSRLDLRDLASAFTGAPQLVEVSGKPPNPDCKKEDCAKE